MHACPHSPLPLVMRWVDEWPEKTRSLTLEAKANFPLESFLTRELLFAIQWSRSSRFRDLTQRLPWEVSRPCPSGPKRIRLKTHWKDYISQPAFECLGIIWKAFLVRRKAGTTTCRAHWHNHNSRRQSWWNKTHQENKKISWRNSEKSVQRFA